MPRSNPRRAGLLAACVIALSAASATAQDAAPTQPPAARAVKVNEPPLVDGNILDDPAWRAATPISDFWQTSPDAGRPASERTEVRIVYTDTALYFGVVLFDADAQGLTVSDSRRDSSLDDSDSFRILLDTYRDRQNGFVFATNPAALEYDGQVSNEGGNGGVGGAGGGRQQAGSGGGFNLNWDGAWTVRTAANGAGWTAEFEIPFRTLRYEAGEREWGLNFQRTIRRRKEIAYWAPLPIQFDLMRVSLAGSLTGLNPPAQRNLKLIPYALTEARRRSFDGPDTDMLGDIGLDAKYSITPSLTLDATLNTDFAQVEVDEQQVNLDRFNLFFPEKRPFFLENAGLFSVGSSGEAELFFSRRIGISDSGEAIPIIGGARLSGRAGPVNVGVLNMQTDDVDGLGPANNFTVGRLRRDFRGRSNVGAMFVQRQATGDGAIERRLQPGVCRGRALGCRRHRPGLRLRRAHADTRPVQRPACLSDWRAQRNAAAHACRSPTPRPARNFRPEVGFLSRTGGFRKIEANFFSRLRPQALSKFQEIRPHSTYRAFWNHDGFQETGYWHIDSHWELKNAYEFHTGMNVTREGVLRPFEIYPGVRVLPGTYDHAEAQFVLQTNQGAPIYGRMQVARGGFFGGDRFVAVTAAAPARRRDLQYRADLDATTSRWPAGGSSPTSPAPACPTRSHRACSCRAWCSTTTAPTAGPATSASAGCSRPTPASSSSTRTRS